MSECAIGCIAANIRRNVYPRISGTECALCSVAVFWDRLTGVQDAPPGWAVAASAAVALLIVISPRLWRMTRIAITIAHESGHAVVSLLSGRRLEGIRLHADTSGETRSRGRRNGPGIVLTALAGYLTPPLLGAGAAALLAAHRVNLLLSLLLVLLAVTLLMVRNWYGCSPRAPTPPGRCRGQLAGGPRAARGVRVLGRGVVPAVRRCPSGR